MADYQAGFTIQRASGFTKDCDLNKQRKKTKREEKDILNIKMLRMLRKQLQEV